MLPKLKCSQGLRKTVKKRQRIKSRPRSARELSGEQLWVHLGSILGAKILDCSSHFSVAFLDGFVEGFGLVLEAIWLHFAWSFWLFCWTLRKMRDPTKMV